MDKITINGNKKLCGKVLVKSAKNAMLPLIAASILLDFEVGFLNCPKIDDVLVMLEIVKSLGGKYRFERDTLFVDCSSVYISELPKELSSKIRASIFLLGPLIGRFRKAMIVRPGGCDIGDRPIEMHLETLTRLGVEFSGSEYLYCRADKLSGNKIRLPFSSVGVTENIIMASVLAEGETIILNAAKEPEIVCLADFLNRFGANIKGAGSSRITINGVKKLKRNGGLFKPITDRIEVGTYLLACMATGGEIEISGANYLHNVALIKKIFDNACKMTFTSDKIYIKCSGAGKGLGVIATSPYPGFATDLQSQTLAYALTLNGTTTIKERVFNNRFSVVSELKKMGANVKVNGTDALVNGVGALNSAEVTARDLRGGAALIIAALKAEGVSTIHGVSVIDRGYYQIENKLKALGADVERK